MSLRDHLPLVFAAACLGLAAAHHRRARPVVLLLRDTAPAPAMVPHRLEPRFAATMTADDVARGVWALAQGQGPGVSPEQRASLLPAARDARDARVALDAVQTRHRVARERVLDSSGALLPILLKQGWSP